MYINKLNKKHTKPSFLTLKHLEDRVSRGADDEALLICKAWSKAINKYTYSTHLVLRFSQAISDVCTVSATLQKFKRAVNRGLFRKHHKSTLKFIFIIETDRILHKHRSVYHVHCLVTELVDPQHRFSSRFPSELTLIFNQKKQRQRYYYSTHPTYEMLVIDYDYEQVQVIENQFQIFLFQKAVKTKVNTANPKVRIACYIQDIYFQQTLTDYLLKTLKISPQNLYVDVETSDLCFD